MKSHMGFMKKIQIILLFTSFILHVCYSQCPGDVNVDYRVDGDDILAVVDHVLTTDSILDDSFINGDLDGSTVIDLFDLTALTDISLATENEFSNMTCAEVHTECWIFNKDADYVYSFASYFTENGEIEFGDRNIYPRSVIKKMVRI